MTATEWINWITNLVTALVTTGVVATVAQKMFNRKARAQEQVDKKKADEKQAARDEEDAANRRRDAEELLAASRATAQRVALESSGQALEQVTRRCDQCLEELHGLRDITGKLIDAVEGLMLKDDAESRADVRAAVRLARRVM